jgi:small-conductance mechanosensitive channel
MLLEELKKAAAGDQASAVGEDKGALVNLIQGTRDSLSTFKERLAYLKTGGATELEEVPGLFAYLGRGEGRPVHPVRTILSVLVVFIAAFGVEMLFHWYTAALRQRIAADGSSKWRAKGGRLLLRSGIDAVSITVFIAATLGIFYLFLDHNHAQRVLMATYLVAIVIIRLAYLLSRLLLAPKNATLRFLPLGDTTALQLHRWVMVIVSISSLGMLTCGVMRLAGTSEANHIQALTILGLVLSVLLIAMILQNRKKVSDILGRDVPPDTIRARFASRWHHLAIGGVLVMLLLTVFNLIMGHYGGFLAFKTLLMLPLYFLLDWMLKQILRALFGFVATQGAETQSTPSAPPMDDDDETAAAQFPEAALVKSFEFSRMRSSIEAGLRVALAVLFVVWTLNIWGLELTVGQAVTRAAINILIVVLLCYVGWELLNAAIQRRLQAEMPDDDEEQEEGGAGGSRIGTLLLLLRKFMLVVILVLATMIILSAIGVDIGPLIAGAGVLGLAIGFGAQTLVKDIISGVFFLVDDAFRVGDYIEVGGSKGMVEHISLRSFKLRHPRGMVNTIPFGDISTVTNFSRDYIVTKLDFRVRYDTDVEKVRKIIKKKVYKPILKNPDLGPKLLDKIKSQGVRELDDSAMIMRVKYKTIPGEQFAIRKEVYRLLQEAFREAGIEFAHKNVTVYMPPEASAADKATAAGAAAAAAAEQATQA